MHVLFVLLSLILNVFTDRLRCNLFVIIKFLLCFSSFVRWDKPEKHIVDAMESRMKDIDLNAERNLKVRERQVVHKIVINSSW